MNMFELVIEDGVPERAGEEYSTIEDPINWELFSK